MQKMGGQRLDFWKNLIAFMGLKGMGDKAVKLFRNKLDFSGQTRRGLDLARGLAGLKMRSKDWYGAGE